MEKDEVLSLFKEVLGDNPKSKEMLNLFSSMTKKDTGNVKNEDKTALNGIRACLPYLEGAKQKNIGLFIKVIEMQGIIEQYKLSQSYNRKEDEDWRCGMLMAAKPYLSDYNSQKIDVLIKLFTLKELL